MRRRKLTLPWAALGLATVATVFSAGCAQDPGPLTWKELQPLYFEALNLTDDAKRQALPDFEQRLENVSKNLLQRLDDGDLTDEVERPDAGLALLYQGILLHVGQHGVHDGYLKPTEILRPQRYAAGGDDQAELIARMARSESLFMHAAELRPDDKRLDSLALSVRYNRESLDGPHSPALLLEMLTAARTDFFGLFTTVILWHDAAENPANAAHIEQLVDAVCAPDRFDCNRMGPPAPPVRPIDGERKLTQEVNGPVLISDLLVRRAEALLVKADAATKPNDRAPLLGEAMGRLQYAKGTVGFVTTSVKDPALAHYPATAYLPARADRIQQLIAATQARLDGAATPPDLPDADYYTSRTYLSAYQCVSCHTKGPTTMGFPK